MGIMDFQRKSLTLLGSLHLMRTNDYDVMYSAVRDEVKRQQGERERGVTLWLGVLSLLFAVIVPLCGWAASDHIDLRTKVATHAERLRTLEGAVLEVKDLLRDIRKENNDAHAKIESKLDRRQ